MTESEKLDILLQVMSCVGVFPMPLENIAHDTGFSGDETRRLIAMAICKGYPVKVTLNGEFYYQDPVERQNADFTNEVNE